MLREGDKAKIVMSRELREMRLVQLAGSTCVVSKCVYGNTTPGAWVVVLTGIYKKEEWYVPVSALATKRDIKATESRAELEQFLKRSTI